MFPDVEPGFFVAKYQQGWLTGQIIDHVLTNKQNVPKRPIVNTPGANDKVRIFS